MPETNPPQPVCPDRCLSHPSAGPPLTATMRATTAFLLLGLLARWVPLAACRRRLPLCLVALPPARPTPAHPHLLAPLRPRGLLPLIPAGCPTSFTGCTAENQQCGNQPGNKCRLCTGPTNPGGNQQCPDYFI